MSVVVLSDEEALEKFQKIHDKNVLYFTATWCPPCKAIAPVYEELATKYDTVGFGKVDVDDNADAAMNYKIQSVPTFVLATEGTTVANRFSGADAGKLETLVKELQDI